MKRNPLRFSLGNGRAHDSHILVSEGQLEKLENISSKRAKKSKRFLGQDSEDGRNQSAEPKNGAAFALEMFTTKLRG